MDENDWTRRIVECKPEGVRSRAQPKLRSMNKWGGGEAEQTWKCWWMVTRIKES